MTATAEISVVIPTYNRWETLARCLRALQEQETGRGSFEVVVVDDGSTDRTAEFLAQASARNTHRLRYARQANSGPAVARNAGVALARAPIVLLMDDDVLARPGLLREHLDWHRGHPDPRMVLLGHVAWSDEVEVTPFMRFIDSNGMQFGYGQIRDGDRVDFRYAYACNLSLKRELLLRQPFDSRFPWASYEDVELGYRLEREGVELYYDRRADASHYRTVTFQQFLRRTARTGASLRLLHGMHPELRDRLPVPRRRRMKRISTYVLALFARLLGLRPAEAMARSHWRAAIRDELARGYRGGRPR
jgi:glycosyltransferase involved in cell wall biosynthesis